MMEEKTSPTFADAHSVDDRREARSANRSGRKMTAKSFADLAGMAEMPRLHINLG
jgi:hypothetical protein